MTQPTISHISRRVLLAACLGTFASGAAQAQAAYPSRPIKLMVGFSAGGGIDAVARLLGPRLSTVLGQQIVVENRAGAAGLIAGDIVSKASPDGYTLLLGDSSALIAQHLQPRMSFDPIKSFVPVAGVFKLPLLIVASNEFPARTPAEFLSAMKAAPGMYSYATSGVGQVQHLGFEMIKGRTKSFVVHVPYRGASQILPDVISGLVPLAVVSASAGMAQVKAGRIKAIAVMSPDTLAGAESVPPLSSVLPGFDAVPRIFIAAPAGTPQPIVDQLSAALKSVMSAPDMAGIAALQGAVPAYLPAAQLVADLKRESVMWGKIVSEQKITAD